MNNKAHLRPQDYDSNGDIIPMSMKEEKGDLISREALKEELKHDTCVYTVKDIYLDPASKDLYHLFLHCTYCGKSIKLCVRTENNIINWLGGTDK